MKKHTLKTLILVAALIITAGTLMVMAYVNTNNEPQYEANVLAEQHQAYYISVSGTVVEIFDNSIKIQTGEYDEAVAYLNITDRTVFPFDSDTEIGDTVRGYVRTMSPMTMIYPPQYTVDVLIAGMPTDRNVHVDRFAIGDNDNFPLISYGGTFAFAIDDDTVIVTADGDEFNFEYGDLEHRRLVVIYGMSTRSIPELATAIEVIVMFEDPVTGPEPLPDNFIAEDIFDISDMLITVDDKYIIAPPAFMADDGITVMVPLRAIAEELGFAVSWLEEENAVELESDDVSLKFLIGNATIIAEEVGEFGRPSLFELPVAPVLLEDLTYVPLRAFFIDVLNLPNASVYEGRIEIQSIGVMMR